MRNYPLFYALVCAVCVGAETAFSLNDQWSVDVNAHTAVQRVYKQGETWEMRISLRDGLKHLNLTGATAHWYWYTNATDNVWWTNTASVASPALGLVTVPWTPAMDVGAPVYFYWLGIWQADPTSPLWRVTGTIRMLTSPGFTPNTQPLPVRTLDFSAITVTNAPWMEASAWQTGSNALASALQHASTNTVPAQIADAIAAIPPPVETDTAALGALASNRVTRLQSQDGTQWIDGTGGVWRVAQASDRKWFYADWLDGGSVTTAVPSLSYPLPDNFYVDVLPTVSISCQTDETYDHYTFVTITDYYQNSGLCNVSNGFNFADGEGAWASLFWQDVAGDGLTTQHVDSVAMISGLPNVSTNGLASTNDLKAATNGLLSTASGDARYLSSTPGWFHQGSMIVSTNTWTTNLTGYAAVSNGMIALVPYATSRHDVTGTVTVTSQCYIVGVLAAWSMALSSDPTMPRTPMGYRAFERVSPTSFTASAWCSTKPADANPYYWGYVSNIVVQTYDRAEMAPGTYTNDAAGIVSRVDSLPTASGVPVTGNGHARAAVNAESMRLYVDARKDEIASSAYNWTPAGRPSPSAQTFTVDEPLVQQGAISYLNSGDYYCMSYAGGDWISSTTGSVWRIGPSGRVSFEIASTNRMLHISGFSVAGGYATLDISTNWVVGTPSVEFTDNLANPQWLSCPAQVMSNGVSFWRGTCPAVSSNRFFRVVDPSGNNVIRSHTRHEFLAGVTIGPNTFHSLTKLKAQLEALP